MIHEQRPQMQKEKCAPITAQSNTKPVENMLFPYLGKVSLIILLTSSRVKGTNHLSFSLFHYVIWWPIKKVNGWMETKWTGGAHHSRHRYKKVSFSLIFFLFFFLGRRERKKVSFECKAMWILDFLRELWNMVNFWQVGPFIFTIKKREKKKGDGANKTANILPLIPLLEKENPRIQCYHTFGWTHL